ncbi:MAG: dephospho-CoA kinase [Candidatus Polarisedimenticolaceae bacterium]|nr:dephospho-CoA kinase [Candidatus Polarisedimenticolaceae bacterium]
MLIIGLTGGIGSGKSTVCDGFAALGTPIIDADLVAREVVMPGTPGLTQVINQFGQGILTQDGSLDRNKLRELVFSDDTSRKRLEALLHPLIREEMDRRLARLKAPYAILAIPLLLEGGRRENIDRILVVDAEESQQIARACQRDRQNPEQIHAIIAAQCSRKDRLSAADDVIYNTGDLEHLNQQVTEMHNHYLRLAANNS